MFSQYHKIQTVFKRHPDNKYKTVIEGEFADPIFEYLADNQWIFTEKVDGTNIRITVNEEDKVIYAGKTDKAEIPTFLLNRLREIFEPIQDKIASMFEGKLPIFYGEGYGNKIQKHGSDYISDGQDFVLFDIKVNEYWLSREQVQSIAGDLGLDVVPIVGSGTLYDMVDMVKAGFNSKWGDFIAEGIVARPLYELNHKGHRVITKLKYKDFRR